MRTRDAVRTVGGRLPPGGATRARGLALTWGRATAAARLTPGLLVVGAQRAGTTTMFRLLAEHPDLVRPTLSKGTGYFDDDHHRGREWYQGHFPLRRPSLPRSTRGAMAFECSGYYLFHPLAASRIAAELPDVHVVVMVRDPAVRALSAHRHETARGFETLSFEAALDAEAIRTAGETARLVERPGYTSFAHRHHAYAQRGEYAAQVLRFQEALGAARVHVLDADDFFADPRRRFLALQDSLGLDPWAPARVDVWNARPGPPLEPALRRRLEDHFAPHDDRLAEILGDVPSWRRAGAAS